VTIFLLPFHSLFMSNMIPEFLPACREASTLSRLTKKMDAKRLHLVFGVIISVAVPKPVERQLIAGTGAGAEVYLARLQSRVCKFL
jgi:hypothetical protein